MIIQTSCDSVTSGLDEYVTDPDNKDEELTWSYRRNVRLSGRITNRVATISVPDSQWNGSVVIAFRVAGPGGLYDEDGANFTVLEEKGDPNKDRHTDLTDTLLALHVLAAMDNSSVRSDYASSGADVNGDKEKGTEEGLAGSRAS